MRRHPWFIPSPRRLIDLAIALLILTGAVLFRYQTHGRAQVAAAHDELEQTREANQARLLEGEHALQAARADSLTQGSDFRALQEAHAEYLGSRLDAESDSVRMMIEHTAPLRAEEDSLASACAQARQARDAARTELALVDANVRAERERVEELGRGATERRARALEALELLERGRRGGSDRLCLAVLLDRRSAENRVALQVSRDLRGVGPASLGLVCAITAGGSAAATALLGGAYVRTPTGLPRCTIDLAAGWESWRGRSGSELDGTRPAYGATARFALRQPGVSLLAGLQRSGASTALRLGLAAHP